MLRHILSLILFLSAFMASASPICNAWGAPDGPTDRAQWMREMQRHQNDFIAKELGLSDKQRADFMPLYNKMREEMAKESREARNVAKKVKEKGEAATEADYESATDAYLNFRAREAEIEKSYYRKFGHILSKRQLYRLNNVERKFDRMLMQHRGRGAKNGAKPKADK